MITLIIIFAICKSVLKSFRIFNYTNTGFIGYVSSEIVYSLTRNRWEILNSHSKDILAFMNETSKLPIGKHPWYFTHSNCVDDGKKYRTLDFHKYVVQAHGIYSLFNQKQR